MKVIHQLAPLEFNTALKHQTAQVQSNSAVLPAGHLFGWAASSIKRLLVVGLLALSLSAFAGDPTATDMERFIKFTGKQAVTSPVEQDERRHTRVADDLLTGKPLAGCTLRGRHHERTMHSGMTREPPVA